MANPIIQSNKEQEYMNQEIRNALGNQTMEIVSLRVKLKINEERIKEFEDQNRAKKDI